MPLFRAYDLEHAALIEAGHPVQWPEASVAREQRAEELAGKIADFFTPNSIE